MEVVIDYEFLKGSQDEVVIKELSVADEKVVHLLHFQSSYAMTPYAYAENGLNRDDGHIPYRQLETVLSEEVAGYAHLYSYGASKYEFLSELLGRPFSIWKILGVQISAISSPDRTASYLVLYLRVSVAQHETQLLSLSG